MSVRVVIVDGPIEAGLESPAPSGRAGQDNPAPSRGAGSDGPAFSVGAVLVFEGLVRGLEDGRPIAGLDYEVYEPMATRQMEAIAGAIVAELGLIGVDVWHSRGRVAVGECSLRVVVRAPHRQEALTAMERFIDSLKRDVPIWKSVVPVS